MAEIGSLFVRIGAQTKGLQEGLRDSESRVRRFGAAAGKLVASMAKVGAGAAAAGAALGTMLTKQGLAAVDAQAKLARSMDATADGLRAMQLAADRAGVSTSAMQTAAQNLNRELAGAARTGTGPAADALDRLGLSAEHLASLDVDQRMALLADRMHELGMSAGDAQDTMRDLGIRSREMALLMIDGGDAIRSAAQDVQDFGLSLSEVDSRNVERANDALADVSHVLEVVRQRLAAALAPVIEMISNRFTDAAREAGGFRDAIDRGIRLGVTGFSRLVDVVEVVRRAFMVMGQSLTFALASNVRNITTVAEALIRGPVEGVNALIRAMNRIPGINVEEIAPPELSTRLREIADEAALHMESAQQRIRDAFTQPLPGEAIRRAYDEAVERANAASEAEIAAAEERNRRLSELRGEQVDAEAEVSEVMGEAQREQLAARLERLRTSLLDELELQEERHQRSLETLQEALEHELLTEEEHKAKLQALEEQHAAAITRIRERAAADNQQVTEQSMDSQVAAVANGLRTMIQTQDQGNRSMFEANKVAAISEAIVSAYQGISKTLSAYPWPVAGALAAKHAAVAFGQVSAIRRQSFGSSSAPSLPGGGGGGAVAGGATQGGGGGQTSTLQVQGISSDQFFSGQAVRDLAERLLDFQRDGGRVLFSD